MLVGAVKFSVALPAPGAMLFNVGAPGTSGVPIPIPPSVIASAPLLAAFEPMTTLPVRAPTAVGAKVTVSVQEPPATRPEPQLFVTAKSPVAMMVVNMRLAPPLLANVTVFGVLVVPAFCSAKLSDVGLSETSGTFTPVPFRVIVFGLLAASLLTTMLPFRAPGAVGVNVTLMVQVAVCANVAPQVVVRAKSPLATMLAILRTAPPVLVKVIDWAALVVPTL